MRPLPLTELGQYKDVALFSNELYNALFWISPILNPDCGKVEPSAQYLKAGLLAYANGTDWDPGSGEGYYYYNSASAWTQL